ncbi:hypothetical protein [Lysobacter gummosus]|uniref:hypothetical protein n=1 Tax=Lysobacter gummosus TaxID=262324 RepID=UPI003633D514
MGRLSRKASESVENAPSGAFSFRVRFRQGRFCGRAAFVGGSFSPEAFRSALHASTTRKIRPESRQKTRPHPSQDADSGPRG